MGETFTLRPGSEQTEGAWQPIPDQSSLRATVVSAGSRKMPFKEFDSDEAAVRIEWTFQVEEDGTFFHRKVKGLTFTEFNNHADCRFYQWVKTLLGGKEFLDGFVVDLEDLVGLECIIQVNQKVGGPKKEGTGNYVNNNVIDVRPARDMVTVGSAHHVDEEPF